MGTMLSSQKGEMIQHWSCAPRALQVASMGPWTPGSSLVETKALSPSFGGNSPGGRGWPGALRPHT